MALALRHLTLVRTHYLAERSEHMGVNRIILSTVLCSGVLVLGACGMSDRDGDRGRTQSSARGSAPASAQTTQVQQALKAKGYDPGAINGVMSSQTQEALRRFQKENGLQVTGTVDAQTAKALGVSTSTSGSAPSRDSSSGSSGSSSGSRGSSSSTESGSSGSSGSRSGPGY
jgi:hypothetical protein